MNKAKVDWSGNYPAIVTPFTSDREIDRSRFADNIGWLLDQGAQGVVVAGCTGEAWALSDEERLELFRLASEVVDGQAVVIGGTGGISTQGTVELTLAAKQTGLDGVMILPPYYAAPSASEIVAHYRTISDAIAFPIMLYNIPSRTSVNLTPAVLDILADIEWVVALKESHDDFVQLEETVGRVGDRIRVFSGFSAARGVAATAIGCVGLVSSMDAHLMGREAIALYALTRSGDLEAARTAQQRALSLVEQLHRLGSEASVLKAAMNLIGRPGGHVRPPLMDLAGEAREAVREYLVGHDFVIQD